MAICRAARTEAEPDTSLGRGRFSHARSGRDVGSAVEVFMLIEVAIIAAIIFALAAWWMHREV